MIRAALCAALLLASSALHAQYPSRNIQLVVPFNAGSDADLSARNLAQHASQYLDGHTIVVQNQPGASGAIGTLAVRKAPPDGHTLLLARIASQVILPATDPKTPYKPDHFTYLSLLEINPYLCAVKNGAPYGSMKDLVADIRRRPGKLNFGTVGAGTIQNFGPQYLLSLVGLPRDAAVGIPYKGSADVVTALVGGQVQFACSNLGTLLGQFRAGTLRPLMTTTRRPLHQLPDVPTARSLGWPEMERMLAWSALAGPPGLPGEVVSRWSEIMAALSRDIGWLAGNEKLGGIPSVRSSADTAQFVREQYKLFDDLAERVGAR
jgi:tripartite-type tricarboxylate transporter receptor subunit TctC